MDENVSRQGEKPRCSEHGNLQGAELSQPTEQLQTFEPALQKYFYILLAVEGDSSDNLSGPYGLTIKVQNA